MRTYFRGWALAATLAACTSGEGRNDGQPPGVIEGQDGATPGTGGTGQGGGLAGSTDAGKMADAGTGGTGGSGASAGTGGSGASAGTGGSGASAGTGGSGASAGMGGRPADGGPPNAGTGGTTAACGSSFLCTGTMSTDGWCIEHNLGPELRGTWSSGFGDTWVVGVQAGRSLAAHFDGCKWVTVPAPGIGLEDVWGAAPADVWAVGASGTALHWNGSEWVAAPTPMTTTLRAVHGTSSTDIWVASDFTLHWDGSMWRVTQLGFTPTFDVWAVSPDDVWLAAGDLQAVQFASGRFFHHTVTMSPVFSIWAGPNFDVWEGGQGFFLAHFVHFFDQRQAPVDSGPGFVGMAGVPGDVWAVGGRVARLVGDSVIPVTSPAFDTAFKGVWVSPAEVLLVGGGTIVRRPR